MDKVVLYGAGPSGRWAARYMQEQGWPPFALCDANPALWGRVVAGFLCLPLAQCPKDALYVVTDVNGSEVLKDLAYYGYTALSLSKFLSRLTPVFVLPTTFPREEG